ncbi:heparinase II/III domain-containing protein [Alicyclobacillus fastidiosus]|uniref:heparinase II/III domain-containing protein n=1 Tax=Alicyclobacillus fastidiosus TaxID=392011 RepID=UPI0023EA2452|nr:heparinase II/III family protein [Alicyclobacillus fastidiosus]GMA60201.1 hypothetical protein GCM10025859_06410 [Alicyclobacillus fastidiosus]
MYGASNGSINVYDHPLVQEIGRFLYRSLISENYYINFADCPAVVKIPANIAYRYGKRIDDDRLVALGAYAHQLCNGDNSDQFENRISMLRELPALFNFDEIENIEGNQPIVRDVWFDGIEVMTARQETTSTLGFYVAAKGGTNDESHNHNDVGQFIVYFDGCPLIVDVGVETYTSKTFSSKRYDIWTMQSEYHNLPTVNGFQQQQGELYRANHVSHSVTDECAKLTMDIASAYPDESGIMTWVRGIALHRGIEPYVEISDVFELESPTTNLTFSLMTCEKPDIFQPGVISLSTNQAINCVHLSYNNELFDVHIEGILLHDDRLKSSWGSQIYRSVFTAKQPLLRSTSILSLRERR